MLEAISPTAEHCGVSTITPKTALVLSDVANGGDIRTLVAQHRMYTDPEGRTRMGSGKLIGPERLADIVDSLSETATRRADDGFLPANVLAHGSNMVAWHVPGARRPMFFAIEGKQFALHVAWPDLLFVARGRRLTLAALDTSARPEADSPVYHAPLMNHSAESGLCFGSVAMPARSSVATMADYEAAVFESNFSHVNGGNHLIYRMQRAAGQLACGETHLALYRSLEKRKVKRFPKRHLLPMNTTVAQFLKTAGA